MSHISNVTTHNLSYQIDISIHDGHHLIPALSLLLITAIILAMAWKSKPYLSYFSKAKLQYIPLGVIPSRHPSPIRIPCAITGKFEFDQADNNDPLNEIITSVCTESVILNAVECRQLNEYLPVRLATKSWSLAYSTAVHGRSLAKFFRQNKRLSSDRSVILLIRDTLGAVFGAFCPTPWVQSPTHIGNGETFVFRLRPDLKIFPWSRENAFFVIGQKKYIAVGGGSKFALWLDDSFEKGSSGASETFRNSVLSTLPSFDCSVMELWAV